MKKFTVVPAFLAAVLLTSIAFAAPVDKIEASFETLSASGVSGNLTLWSAQQGGTQLHGMVRGLQPNTEYVSQYFTDGACGAAPGVEIVRFTANPAGIANFNKRIDASLESIRSVSIQTSPGLVLQACAAVPVQ